MVVHPHIIGDNFIVSPLLILRILLCALKIRTWERQYWRVPSLRPIDVFTNHAWEDHMLVTARLLGGPAEVDREEEEDVLVSGE